MPSRPPFFTSARGRLLIFNLLVVAVTLMRARFMLPVMSSSVCCCTCSWIWLA